MKTVQEAVNARYSERYMDPNKKVSSEFMEIIIEAGRKAPSGLGMEPWKFLVVDGDKTQLMAACYNQQPVKDASHVIVFLYAKADLVLDGEYLKTKYEKAQMPSDQIEKYLSRMPLIANSNYTKEQTFIAMSQMVLQATALGVDTLIMGGIQPEQVASLLGVDQTKYAVSLVVAFGYRTGEPKARTIRDKDQVVEYITL